MLTAFHFVKMHGIGNDYIYVDALSHCPRDPAALSRLLSPRHFAVGADGLVLILPSSRCDFRMRMFNADGSEAEMCGNAIRCVGKFLFDRKLTDKRRMSIETLAGDKWLDLSVENGLVTRVRVDMGEVILSPELIPVIAERGPVTNLPVTVRERTGNPITLSATVVSVGNPHAVFFVDHITDDHVHVLGPQIEVHPLFPRKVNVEFVEQLSPSEFRMRVWERGSGETMACGTGAAAVLAAALLCGRSEHRAVIRLLGGELEIESTGGRLYKTGPATWCYDGVVDVDSTLV